MLVAIVIEGRPVDILHDEVGQPFFGHAPIEKPGNAGVIERREDLAFVAEASEDVLGVHAPPYELDGGEAFEVLIVALGQKDAAHAAAPEWFEDPVAIHLPAHEAGQRLLRFLEEAQHVVAPGIGRQQRLHPPAEFGIALADGFEPGLTRTWIEFDHFIEEVLDLLPAFIHDARID